MTPDQIRADAIRRMALQKVQGQADPRATAYMNPQQPSPETLARVAEANNVAMAGMRPQSNLESFRMGDVQGFTLGSADEMSGLGGEFARERFRAADRAAQEQNPGFYTAGRMMGTLMSPVTRLMPNKTSIPGAAATAATVGAIEGFNEGEGDLTNRAANAARTGATSLLFGGATAALTKGASYGLRRAFQVADERPSIETLRTAKNAAYAEVRRSGVRFDGGETQRLYNTLSRAGRTARFQLDPLSETDRPALEALRKLQMRAGKPLNLNNLDKVRQDLWSIYTSADRGHPFVLEAIRGIDDLIAQKATGNEVMQAARAANSRFAKAELLENAFRKARLQTAATGSGGNILNKYRQAVTRIITNEDEARFFSPEEIMVMERFVEGDMAENVMRRIGKLSPGGNGLMTALNVYAASVDPSMLAITAAATAAKSGADTSAMRGSERILDAVAGFTPRPGVPLQVPAIVGGTTGAGFGVQ